MENSKKRKTDILLECRSSTPEFAVHRAKFEGLAGALILFLSLMSLAAYRRCDALCLMMGVIAFSLPCSVVLRSWASLFCAFFLCLVYEFWGFFCRHLMNLLEGNVSHQRVVSPKSD
ncbi:unnamed protein product [Sphagnum jensenii]|jgi:hypothetical protein|uniref:Uncharacterized protein n=1 Tax=Sphagnum jensenii TaxID=128206 RepID=A0ABP0X570_9BRYO